MYRLSKPAIKRFCLIYRYLGHLINIGESSISSAQLQKQLGISSQSFRKDISYLGDVGVVGSGYQISVLRKFIGESLKISEPRNSCVVGLGRLGSAIINSDHFLGDGYSIVAGFDSDINHLDRIRTKVDVFPSYEIAKIVVDKKIELAAVAVPEEALNKVVKRLIEGGIKGILNFSSGVIVNLPQNVVVRNMDILNEFTVLSAEIARNIKKNNKRR